MIQLSKKIQRFAIILAIGTATILVPASQDFAAPRGRNRDGRKRGPGPIGKEDQTCLS